jgi:hypothetical protein
VSTTHKLFGERVNPSKQQLRRKLRQATVDSGFKMKPGYLYTVVRAISARVNQNYDGWPSDELKKSYHTFIGKPVFVNHENYDPKTARGVVVAARYVENGRDKYIEVIQEIDAPRFPLLAHEIRTGGLDSVSMGAEAGFTICSVCDNKAVDERDMCQHVMFHKGEMLPRRNHKTGKVEKVLCYESCHKLGFFELSYVFDPADETAVASKVVMASRGPDTDAPGGNDVTDLAGSTWANPNSTVAGPNNPAPPTGNQGVRLQQQGGKYTKDDFAISDGKKPWEREAPKAAPVDDGFEEAVVTAFRKGAPFAEYDDFADCESKNSDKNSPSAYCGEIKHRTEDKKASFEDAVLRIAGFRTADNQCLPGEDCDSGSAGPSGDEVKADPNLQPLTPGAGSSGGSSGGSSSAPAAGTSAPIGSGAASGASGGAASGDPGKPDADGVLPSSRPLYDKVKQYNPDIGTYRVDDYHEHDHGALDVMTSDPAVAERVKADAFGAGSPYVLWHQKQWNSDGTSSPMEDRGSPTQNHMDHVHTAPITPKSIAASFEGRVLTAAGFKAPPPENSAYTQVSNTLPTYQKAHAHFDAAGAPQGNVLDYGAGKGHSSQFGDTFEPNPRGDFQPTHQRTEDIPDGGYHRVTNLNVLNVVPPKVRDHIVDEIGRVMAPGGHAVITTRGRNEVLSTKGGVPANNGDPNAIIVGQGSPRERYQKGFDPKELHQYVSGRLGDGYDVNPLKLGPAGVHIVRKAGRTGSQIRKAWGETEAPVRVDTLREEGTAPEDDSDDFYHFVESPRELQTPDLSQAQQVDREQSQDGMGAEDLPGAEDDGGDDGGQFITLKIPVPPQAQSDVLPTQPFDAGPAGAPAPPMGPPPGAEGPPPEMPPGPPPGPEGPPVPPEQQQIAASTLAYFNDYFGHRVANWYDAIAQGREMTAAERADYQLQTSTLRNTAEVSTTSRNPRKGTANMGRSTLAERGKTASRGRRQHFAEGPLTDGGDVSRNDQGEQEEAFISETPPEETVVAPADDATNISNTENNLVAKVQRGQQQLLRDAKALAALRARQGSRRTAEEMNEAGGPVSTTVDPELSGTDDQSLKGDDFQSANPNDGVVPTNPHDASLHKFEVFDNWLARKTGKRSNQHTSATIRRYAEHYANATNTDIQAYFPALGIVLREARKNDKATAAKRKPANTKGAKMRKRADEKLEVAAPDGRVDVEAPVRDTTDAEAQASQFDRNDFGNNAGDDIAEPDLSTDQNFAPGEANKTGRAKTAGELLGIRCAEAMIDAGLEPNDRQRKYALAAEYGRMSRGLILDRIALTERFAGVLNQVRAEANRKVASGSTRGTTRSPIPAGMSAGAPRQMTAGTRRTAANDPQNDALLFG